jgi:hypothetical protein
LIRRKLVGSQSASSFESQSIPLLYNDLCLESQCDGGEIVLHWPETAAAFALESAVHPVDIAWSQWPTAPATENGTNTVRVLRTEPARFFRLRWLR